MTLDRYSYDDVRGTIRVDRNASALFGEIPDATEDLKMGVRRSPNALVQNLGGEVHQDGRSTFWIKGKYGNRLRVIVEQDEEGLIPAPLKVERARVDNFEHLSDERVQEEVMRRSMQNRVNNAIAHLGDALEVEEAEDSSTEEIERLEDAMREAIEILSNPKEVR